MARHEFRKVVRGSDGLPVEGAEVRFYEPGTTTPRPVYATINGSTPAGQPIESDADGRVLAYLDPGLVYKIVTTFDAVTDTLEHYAAVDPVPAGPWVVPYRDADGALMTRVMADGRAIFEADPVTDALGQFLPGGTFTVLPTVPRHRWLKVGDTSSGLTQNMTVAVDKTTSGWVAGDQVMVVKGDTSNKLVTVSGLDEDGLGTTTLRRPRDFVMLLVQSTDSEGIKFERGPQGRINPAAEDVSASNAENGLVSTTVQGQLDELAEGLGSGVVSASTEWPVTPPAVVEGVMTITDAHLVATLSATGGEVTLEQRIIPLLNNADPSVGFELRLSFGSTAGGEMAAFRLMDSQTGAITIVSDDDGEDPAGEVDGADSITPPSRGIFTVHRLAGSTKNYESSINDSPTFRGQVTLQGGVEANNGGVSGALTMLEHSGGFFTTVGNVTCPNEAGFSVTLRAGDAHTVGAGGATESLATGDIVTVLVFAAGVVRMLKVPAADVKTLATS